MYAEFDESLITGNEMIDSQHQELIEKINDLLRSCERNNDRLGATQMLGYLAEYTDFHFGEEEKLQEEIGYPGIEKHKEKHEELRKVVSQLHEMLVEQDGPTAEFAESVNNNVTKWLYNHIKTFDRSVAEYKYMRENGERL